MINLGSILTTSMHALIYLVRVLKYARQIRPAYKLTKELKNYICAKSVTLWDRN